jgi:DNA-binding transcriptional LysR family regulator
VMNDLNEALAMARRVGEGRSGDLNIGYGSLTLLHSLFRAAVKQFHETCPDVTLSLVEMPTAEQPKALADGRIHAGFMHFGPRSTLLRKKRGDNVLAQDETVLDWFRIQTGSLGVVMPRDHPLAGSKSLTLGELAAERFVVVPRSSSSPGYGPLFTLCQKAGFDPNIVQEVSSIATQLNLVSVGVGIGLTVIGSNFSYPDSLVVVPLREVSYTTSFVFGWVKGQADPALLRMKEIVESLAREPGQQ